MERFKLFIPLLIFIVLGTALYFGLGRDPNAMPSALVDRPVPAFVLPSLLNENQSEDKTEDNTEDKDKQTTLDESLFKGEVSLLNVWATWCVACRIEHPYLMDIAKLGVRIIGLNYKDDSTSAQQWLLKFGDPYRDIIFDPEGKLGLDLGVFGAPETYIIDSEGVIRYKYIGVVDDRIWQQKLEPIFRNLGAQGLMALDAESGE